MEFNLKLQLIDVDSKIVDWMQISFQNYLYFFSKDMPFELIEILMGKRCKSADLNSIIDKKGEQIVAKFSKGNHIIALNAPKQAE
ncbi:MAG: hypothetical protein ACTS7E_04250 [Arsenophonus sp. NC-CH8-MAG3]